MDGSKTPVSSPSLCDVEKNVAGTVVSLEVIEGSSVGCVFSFTEHSTIVAGRSRNAQMRLSGDRSLSRFHCRFEVRPPECLVIDLGSRNGTLVNGIPIESTSLINGDQIQIGETHVSVRTIFPIGKNEIANTPTLLQSNTAAKTDNNHSVEFPQIPGYKIEAELGVGGMGAVFRGRQLSNGDARAIKVLHPAMSSDVRNIQRFVREASVIMRLKHKRIVESFEFGLVGTTPFLVMEYIQHVPCLEVLAAAEPAKRLKMAVGIMVRVLQGLQYAHDQQIVHRDLKPSNLLLYYSGRRLSVKLADFGLAKNYMNAGFSGFTTSNEICGTIAYMSPEQIIDCRNAKPACDIYAAGVCLYRMLSGRFPHEGETVARQISMILNRKGTPLSKYIPDVPDGLSALIEKALHRDPKQRFQTADEMALKLLPYAGRSKGDSGI